MKQVFINEAFTKAVNDYLNNKNNPECIEFNSFLVVVIRALVSIYGELDIVNPLLTDNEQTLKDNLTKFDYSMDDIEFFFGKHSIVL